jgi:hypothetical protein
MFPDLQALACPGLKRIRAIITLLNGPLIGHTDLISNKGDGSLVDPPERPWLTNHHEKAKVKVITVCKDSSFGPS